MLDGYGAEPEVEILNRDGGPWRITFADTGTRSTIGERLKLVEPYLGDDEVFMATYGDGLADVDLPDLMRTFEASGKMIMFALVRPHFQRAHRPGGPRRHRARGARDWTRRACGSTAGSSS